MQIFFEWSTMPLSAKLQGTRFAQSVQTVESGRGLPHSKAWRKLKRPIAKAWHAGFAFFALVGSLAAQDISGTFLKGPYLQGPGTDTITIKWESPSSKPGV